MESILTDNTKYGRLWTGFADNLQDIDKNSVTEEIAFQKALSMGYFSQYTSYRQKDLVKRLIEWQINVLAKWIGFDLSGLPRQLDELLLVPEVLTMEYNQRTISPDLLRNLYYVLFLYYDQGLSAINGLKNVVEIGSGYGSFARSIKTYFPDVCVWLIDLPESLAVAHTYLKVAYKDAAIALIDSPDASIPDSDSFDFILISVDQSQRLHGKHFDLAVNIWSLGEMPNSWIKHWFDLLQNHCTVERLYLLNAFGPPVTIETADRANQGNWLFQLDDKWKIKYFEIDPEIHRCPFIKNFYTGLSLYCERIDEPEVAHQKELAQINMREVLSEDWAAIVTAGSRITNIDRPETNINDSDQMHLNIKEFSVEKLLQITEYIAFPRFESTMQGTLFRLWNDFRLNNNLVSAGLLCAFFAMIFKSELKHRCRKEEIFLVEKLPADCILNMEYEGLIPQRETSEEERAKHELQMAIIKANNYFNEKKFTEARELALEIISKNVHQVDCWYLMACINAAENKITIASLLMMKVCELEPSCKKFLNSKDELLDRLQNNSTGAKGILFDFIKNASDSTRNRFIRLLDYFPGKEKYRLSFFVTTIAYIFAKDKQQYLKKLTELLHSDVFDTDAQSLGKVLMQG